MDATRTMFSDVDRFIMLGQIQNAINVLDSRIKREPSERDSWIKLMAICRDEGMENDFYRAYAAFREQFGQDAVVPIGSIGCLQQLQQLLGCWALAAHRCDADLQYLSR